MELQEASGPQGLESWIHMSDLHFGAETFSVCEALRVLVDEQRPQGIVISGDVTQRAKPEEFRVAGAFLEQVSAGRRLVVVPGNHDLPLFRIWERVLCPYRLFGRTFGPPARVRAVDAGIFRFILVDTTRPFRHSRGTLDPSQVEHVERELEAAPSGRVRAVVLHHPLPAWDDAGGRFRGDYASIGSAEDAVRRWTRAGLDLVFCGHTHHPRVLRLTGVASPRGLERTSAEGTRINPVHTPWLLQAGTSLSRRLRKEPNSLYILSARVAPEIAAMARPRPTLRVERWDYSSSTQKFERHSQLLLN